MGSAEAGLVAVEGAVLVALRNLGAGDHLQRSLLEAADARFRELDAVGAADDAQTGSFADDAECCHALSIAARKR